MQPRRVSTLDYCTGLRLLVAQHIAELCFVLIDAPLQLATCNTDKYMRTQHSLSNSFAFRECYHIVVGSVLCRWAHSPVIYQQQ